MGKDRCKREGRGLRWGQKGESQEQRRVFAASLDAVEARVLLGIEGQVPELTQQLSRRGAASLERC